MRNGLLRESTRVTASAMSKKLLCAFVGLCSVIAVAHAKCAASDISIVQDAAYTDMAGIWIQTVDGTLKEDRMAVFTAEFRLFCKSEAIQGADLSAAVVYRSGSEAYTPKESLSNVAVLSNSTGSYQLSFALPEEQMPSGEYKAEIHFAGESTTVASISMFHSVPLITGRHMEFFALLATALQAYYIHSQYSAVH